MTVTQYPVFVKGQTLTDDDLNELRDSLDRSDLTLGRLVGFGINCGLTGAIRDKILVIEPGLAIDQLGEGIVLDETVQLELPGARADQRPPDFLDPKPGGFTPVLTVTVTDVPAVKCNEVGCEGHARQRDVTSAVTLFPGRLDGAIVDFSDEPLLSQQPILVRKTGSIDGAFIALRNAIVARLGDRLDADARAKLAAMTIDADLPAIQGFKAGFLNQVFFATLDMLRCERLTEAGCVSSAGSIGVALGWASQNGADWSWDCSYRHDWRPPTGLALAFLGGRCTDPCDLYRDQINAMINAFEVPVTPAKPDPPAPKGPDKVDICLLERARYSKYGIWDQTTCSWVKIPPVKVPEQWQKGWLHPPQPGDPPYKLSTPEEIYQKQVADPLDLGGMGFVDIIGKKADAVAEVVKGVAADQGYTSDVLVVQPNAIDGLADYQPSLTASFADQVVLTQDSLGKVIGVGIVPGTKALSSVSTELPQVTATADRAEVAARSALETTGSFNDRIATLDQGLAGLGEFQKTMVAWQSATDTRLTGLSGEIQTNVLGAVNDLQLKVAAQIDERVGAAINTVRGGIIEQVRAEIGNLGGALKADFATDLHSTSDAIRAETKADQLTLTTQVTDVGQQLAGLSGRVESIGRETERSSVRIDDVLASSAGAPPRTRTPAFDAGVVGVLENMRASIVAAATPAQRDKVTAALATSDDAFAKIQTAGAAGTPDLAADPQALGVVLESMTRAVEAAGAPPAEVERLRVDTASVIGRVR